MIEYAQMPSADQLRQKFAGAPAEWRAALDANRIKRGMEPLWATPAPAKQVAKQTRTAKPSKADGGNSVLPPSRRGPQTFNVRGLKIELPALPRHCGKVVGLVCPGVSNPVRAAGDLQLLPERVAPNAWRSYLQDVADGKAVCELQSGHYGPVVASTRDGTMVLSADLVEGLQIECTFTVGGTEAALHRRIRDNPKAIGLSCDLVPVRWHHEQRDGKTVRVVDECRLQSHVAVMLPGQGTGAAYTLSRVAAVADDKPETAQRELRKLVMSVAGGGRR
jgi:hypothetical protein